MKIVGRLLSALALVAGCLGIPLLWTRLGLGSDAGMLIATVMIGALVITIALMGHREGVHKHPLVLVGIAALVPAFVVWGTLFQLGRGLSLVSAIMVTCMLLAGVWYMFCTCSCLEAVGVMFLQVPVAVLMWAEPMLPPLHIGPLGGLESQILVSILSLVAVETFVLKVLLKTRRTYLAWRQPVDGGRVSMPWVGKVDPPSTYGQ